MGNTVLKGIFRIEIKYKLPAVHATHPEMSNSQKRCFGTFCGMVTITEIAMLGLAPTVGDRIYEIIISKAI